MTPDTLPGTDVPPRPEPIPDAAEERAYQDRLRRAEPAFWSELKPLLSAGHPDWRGASKQLRRLLEGHLMTIDDMTELGVAGAFAEHAAQIRIDLRDHQRSAAYRAVVVAEADRQPLVVRLRLADLAYQATLRDTAAGEIVRFRALLRTGACGIGRLARTTKAALRHVQDEISLFDGGLGERAEYLGLRDRADRTLFDIQDRHDIPLTRARVHLERMAIARGPLAHAVAVAQDPARTLAGRLSRTARAA